MATRLLLARFAMALSRRRAYHATHPMVEQSEQAFYDALVDVLSSRRRIEIGVAHRELMIDQAPYEDSTDVAGELANRLHRRGVGAIAFESGNVNIADVRQAIAWLARDAEGEARTAGHDIDASWSARGITIHRIAYDRISISESNVDVDREVAALWRVMATVAFQASALELLPGSLSQAADNTDDDDDGWTIIPDIRAPIVRAPLGAGGMDQSRGVLADNVARATDDTDVPPKRTTDRNADWNADWNEDRLESATAESLATALEQRVRKPGHAGQVGFALLSVARAAASASPAVREALGDRLRGVLDRIGKGALSDIIRSVGHGRERRDFVSSVIDVLPVAAIVDWLERSANATEQELSHHLLRILAKMSSHAGAGSSRTPAATAESQRELRRTARELVAEWKLDDPNTVEHNALLNTIADVRETPLEPERSLLASGASITDPLADAERLVQMACEIDVVNADTIAAVETLIAEGRIGALFDWWDRAPGMNAAAAMREVAVKRDSVLTTLLREPFDAEAARMLVAKVADPATLLDALEQARARTARRLVIDRLREFGLTVEPLLVARLEDSPPWYFARNLLTLLRDVRADVEGTVAVDASDAFDTAKRLSLLEFLGHSKEQVRIEALRLLVEQSIFRDAAIRRALDDASPRIVKAAIEATMSIVGERQPSGKRAISRDLAERLMRLVDANSQEPEVNAGAIRALHGTSGSKVRDWLLEHVLRRSLVLRRQKLADVSPVVIAALEVLARDYRTDPRVLPVLEMASAQRDERSLAVRVTGTGSR